MDGEVERELELELENFILQGIYTRGLGLFKTCPC